MTPHRPSLACCAGFPGRTPHAAGTAIGQALRGRGAAWHLAKSRSSERPAAISTVERPSLKARAAPTGLSAIDVSASAQAQQHSASGGKSLKAQARQHE